MTTQEILNLIINSDVLTVAGSVNAYTGSTTPVVNYATGKSFKFKPNITNTGASTLSVNGSTAKPITTQGNVALTGGELLAGQFVVLVDDGTNYQMVVGSPKATTVNRIAVNMFQSIV
jgi:uncharacterized Zn-binding protein involved in type VI secretion